MSDAVRDRIHANPNFLRLVKKRNSYSYLMISLVMICYYGYILLIAFDKELLAKKISAGMVTSIGIPLGVGVILFTIAVTWIYVRRANSEFDTDMEALVKGERR